MTDDKTALRELLQKACDSEPLREMIAFVAGRLMELLAGEMPAQTRWRHQYFSLIEKTGR